MKTKKRKILSFTTTLRNPERIAGFLSCISKHNGKVLSSETIITIVKEVINNKLYEPMYIRSNERLKEKYKGEEVFSDDEINEIIINSPQNHKETGFDKGWESRYDTWYKISKEFGFLYYEKNKKIEISKTGIMLIDAYRDQKNNNGNRIQSVFLNALAKYYTNNPFRANKNSVSPLPLTLRLLQLLKDNNENSRGLHRKEIPFILCWQNNDVEKLYSFICAFRNRYAFIATDEIIYEKCLELLESNNRKANKMRQITIESVDDYIRKLRITGVISVRGNGAFIDMNTLEKDKISHIISKYAQCPNLESSYEYYQYMSSIDDILIKNTEIESRKSECLRNQKLLEVSNRYNIEKIYSEMKNLNSNKSSKDDYFKIIDAPCRLEFLVSLILIKRFPYTKVLPNYSIDDEGNPTFTAKGGVADIVVMSENNDAIVEVTLMRSRQQSTNEIPAITRHLMEYNSTSESKEKFAIFIAPIVHKDTEYMCGYTKYQYSLTISPYTINHFINKVSECDGIESLKYDVEKEN